MRRLLERELGYCEVAGSGNGGSHVKLVAAGRPQLTWAFHDRRELAPIEVKKILVSQVGLKIEEAKEVVRRA
jgi:hypothetical protein